MFQLFPSILLEVYAHKLPQILDKPKHTTSRAFVKLSGNILLNAFFENTLSLIDSKLNIKEELVKLKIREVIYLISHLNNEDVNHFLANLFSQTNDPFKEVVAANLYNNLKTEDLAFLCNLSLSSFQRKFKITYATSPKKYFLEKKLNKAAVLLKTTDLRISDISYDIGFDDAAHFTKSFQKKFHLSPRNYRKS